MKSPIRALLVAATLAAASPAFAATNNWVGTTGTWATGSNWSSTATPIGTDTITYTGTSTNLTQTLDGSYSIAGIAFTATPTGNEIINAGTGTNTLTLGSGGISTANNGARTLTFGPGYTLALGAAQTWTTSSNNITVNAALSGSANLLLTGAGTVTLASDNSAYSGTINMGPGSAATTQLLVVGNANALGTGTLNARGAMLQASVAGLTLSNAVNVAGGGFRLGGTNAFTLSGLITLDNAQRTIGNYGATTITLGGGINLNSGTGSLASFDGGAFNVTGAITGAGGVTVTNNLAFNNTVITLGGANTYTGTTTATYGTLQFAKEVALYNNVTANWTATNLVVSSGATAAFNVGGTGEFTSADIGILSALGTATGGFRSGSILGLDTTNAGGSFTYASAITNTNGGANTLGLTKRGTGTLALTGNNTYTGTTTVSAGTLAFDTGANTLGALSVAGGTLAIGSGSLSSAGSFTVASGGTFSQTGGVTTLSTTAANSIIIGGFNATSGTISISGGTFNATGTTTQLSYFGQVTGTLNVSGTGVANFGGLNMNASSSSNSTINLTGGTLNIGASGITNTASGTSTINLGAGTVGATGGNWSSALAMSLTNAATGTTFNTSDAVTPTTARTITLSGVLSGTGKLTASGIGALTLSGVNTYTGGTAVASGSTLNVTSTGAIKVGTAGVTVASGATLAVDGKLVLTATTGGLIANSGTIALNAGSAVLDLGGLFNGATAGQTYNLIAGGAITGNFASFAGYTGGLTTTFDNTNGTITFTAVPEPATYGLLGAGALAATALARRRRKTAASRA